MTKQPVNVCILGSTGSIGKQALDVIDKHNDLFNVVAIAAKNEITLLEEQVVKYSPDYVVIGEDNCYLEFKQKLNSSNIEILTGVEGMSQIASLNSVDIVLIALSGSIGILPTISAIEANKKIALANKETLVSAGDLVMNMIKETNSEIIPVDSEHSAIFQCLKGEDKYLENIWLTASGGPFRDFTSEQIEQVTLDLALNHPTWNMGPKITIDSATLMNKGLEVIEAHHLFDISYDNIKVIVHKQSIIHSMIELIDGSFIAHLGIPDMRIPIQYALTYPSRLTSPARKIDFSTLSTLDFQKPDTDKFPCLRLAYEAGYNGGTLPTVMNAANEIAVDSFLNYKLRFVDISLVVEKAMLKHKVISKPSISDILETDQWARLITQEIIKEGF